MQYWTRITEPQKGGRQHNLFKEAEEVYNSLIPPILREPWRNFQYYILDCEKTKKQAKKHGATPDSEYFYYVAVYKGKVCGIADFDIYKEPLLSAMSYIGVRGRNVSRNHRDPPPNIVVRMLYELINEVKKVVWEAGCNSFLIELDSVPVEWLDPSSVTYNLTKEARHHLQWINFLQSEFGAKKIGCIEYRQPKLIWEEELQEHPMHLMLISDVLERDEIQYLSREYVKHLVKFIYLTWYLGGYERTERGSGRDKRLEEWEGYLEKLLSKSTRRLPSKIPIYPIDLKDYRTRRIFISYPQDYVKIARYLRTYLTFLGFKVFFWDVGRERLVGRERDSEIRKEMNKSDIFILLLSEATLDAEGQIMELDYIKDNRNRIQIIPLIEDGVNPEKFRDWIDIQAPSTETNVVYLRFNWNDYTKKTRTIAESLLKEELSRYSRTRPDS